MDSLTHIVLGAAVGELMAGKKLGKRSWLAGAFFQTVPDFDFIAGIWCTPAEDLLAHRGFTHSFLFIILMAPLFHGVSCGLNGVAVLLLKAGFSWQLLKC